MKWKKNVCLIRNENLQFQMNNKTKNIDENDEFIALAVEKGICEDKQLIDLVAEHEHINKAAAAFAIAQFILDYGVFIETDHSHYEITD